MKADGLNVLMWTIVIAVIYKAAGALSLTLQHFQSGEVLQKVQQSTMPQHVAQHQTNVEHILQFLQNES